jgi:hypothetical protein
MHTKQPRLWVWLIMMVLGTILCMGLSMLGIDQVCYNDTVRRQALYPGAEIVESEHSFLRPRAFGFTRLVLSTPDDIEVVRQWIRDSNLDLLRREEFRGLSSLNWRAMPNAEGEGSLLIYTSSCGE